MNSFLASLIFGHSDNLSKTLQHTYISAVEGQSVAKMSVKTLKVMSDTQFDLFWSKVLREASRLDVDDPTLRRKRKHPTRFELSNTTPSFPESPKDYFRLIYFSSLDSVITCIKSRFDQPGYEVYSQMESLPNAANSLNYFENYKASLLIFKRC